MSTDDVVESATRLVEAGYPVVPLCRPTARGCTANWHDCGPENTLLLMVATPNAVRMSGAVSPTARAMPRITAVDTPLRAVGSTQLVGVGAAATILGCAMLVVASGSLLPSVEDWFGARRELRTIAPLLTELSRRHPNIGIGERPRGPLLFRVAEQMSLISDALYLEASRFWQKEGLIKETVEPARTKWLSALESLAPQYRDQKVVENFQFSSAPSTASPSLLTKSVSIYFATGQSAVDPNARKVLDGFAETLEVFQNAYVQVEGNTDNVGSRNQNIALSKVRAESVIGYLVERHRLNRARFVAIGNGPDHPVSDNKTPEGRELNRRTDFKIIKNSSAAPAADKHPAP